LALAKLSTKPWAYFPVDGNYPLTRAALGVWSRPAEFKEAQVTFEAAVARLVAAARAGEVDKVKLAVFDVTKSCKSCHKDFRTE
jgi:cytochrome c556